jgi:beta-phosphoglucomutase
MQWIHQFQLFLFDFDGLLVNTEELHYRAYLKMCGDRGFDLKWSFNRYCEPAHNGATALRDQIYAEFPVLQTMEPNWDVLYAEKKRAYIELIKQGNIQLMDGVSDLLYALQRAGIRRCVVTHSLRELIEIIRAQLPVLQTIPHWFTREDYDKPKPNPDGYLKAIERLSMPGDRIIGFEDTPRGLQALQGTSAKSVLICAKDYPELPNALKGDVVHFESFRFINRV